MRVPPMLAHVSVGGPPRAFRLWVPLFLVWALLLVLLLPLLLVAALAVALAPRRWRFGPAVQGAWVTLCETRGTSVEISPAHGQAHARDLTISLH